MEKVKKWLAVCLSFALFVGLAEHIGVITKVVQAATGEIINDNTTSMSVNGYYFDHTYVKPGDTLRVMYKNPADANAEGEVYNGTVTWEVKKVSAGNASGTDANTNNVSYDTLYSKVGTSTFEMKENYLEAVIYATIDSMTKLTIYCSNIPVMYINSETAYYDVVKADYTDKKTTNITLTGNEKYGDGSYNNTNLWYQGNAQVKLRGNSTSLRPKRPFRIKLDKKADLLGLGEDNGKSYKSKHWVLLANDIDHSLLRNKLLYDFSGEIGTEFYFHSTNVALIYNGQYEGVYQLCEHRRVDEGRIDITNWKSIGEDAAETIAAAEAESKYPNEADAAAKASYLDALQERLELEMLSYEWIDSKKVTVTDPATNTQRTFSFADYPAVQKIKGIDKDTTGGFLAEMDFYSIGSTTEASMTTAYQQPLYVSAPEPGDGSDDVEGDVAAFKTTSLYDYAKNYTQSFEYALHSDDFFFRNSDTKYVADGGMARFSGRRGNWINQTYNTIAYSDNESDGKHYSELFDMDSLVNNFIFVEYAMNWDSMKNSFFYYKDNDKLAKIGPQWDFDWCWGNTNMYNINTQQDGSVSARTSWHTTIGYYTREQFYQCEQWNRMLIRDPYFLTLAYEKYKEVRPIIENMIKEGGLIDQYQEYLEAAGAANDKRWQYTYSTQYGGAVAQGFADSIATIKSFVGDRVAWLDKQFTSVDTLVNSLGYYEKASDIGVSAEQQDDEAIFTATTTNTDAKKICFQVNGTTQITADVQGGTATAKIKGDKLRNSGLNTVVANEMDSAGKYLYLDEDQTTGRVSGNYNIVKSSFANFEFVSQSSELSEEDKNTNDSQADVSSTEVTDGNSEDITVNSDVNTSGNVSGNSNQTATETSESGIYVTKPAKVKSVKLKNKKKKKIKVTWKKVSGAKGYQIQYAQNKKFTKKKKEKYAKKNKVMLKKLKKKKYFVRVRAYKIDSDGNKVFGKWSKVKKITVKK